MSTALDRMSYTLAQAIRSAWFAGHYRLTTRTAPPARPRPDSAARLPGWQAVQTDLQALFQRDWANIAAGLYRMPHDMWPNPLAVLRQSGRFFGDLPRVNRRKRERRADEVFTPPNHGRYPHYYLQNFHYQTDGYLSEESARLYDYQVEVLFTGGADAMRRQLLVPLRDCFETLRIRDARFLDLACGTGRFLRFVKDNYPRLHVTGADLSQPYLAMAERQLRPWSRTAFVQANAESLPFGDDTFDIASCVYLFHELPRAVRRRVAEELARVLRPGGNLLFLDSIQRGDHAAFDPLLDRFPQATHEPYYADYIDEDLPALFDAHGFDVEQVERVFFSRLMVLRRRAS
jgi:ubiquinone/menaquinone biosynthesis C-methylase UbiE